MRTVLLAAPERVVCLIGRDVDFATPVAFSGEQVTGALGTGAPLLRQQNFREVQVRPGYAAPRFGPPVRASTPTTGW
jgi:hypothetical protein